MKIIKKFRLSQMFNNAFLIEEQGKSILIDAPSDIQNVIKFLEENEKTLDEVWLTHCHFDHILGLNLLKEKYKDLEVYISKEEINGINNKEENLITSFTPSLNFHYNGEIKDNQELKEKYPNLSLIFVSGHSLKSTCYYFSKENIIFTGDVLFRETIGRSDLIHGNSQELISTIKEKLFILPEKTEVYSGHGFVTSIGYEKENNKAISYE